MIEVKEGQGAEDKTIDTHQRHKGLGHKMVAFNNSITLQLFSGWKLQVKD